MRRMHRGLVAALESDEVLPGDGAGEELNNAESLETDLLDVADSQVEGDQAEAQVEEATEVVEALESLQVVLRAAAGNGGLDRHGAAVMQVGLESLYARVGLPMSRVSMPSMESYGGASTRIGSTQLALEDIAEKAREIWDAIVKAIKRAIEWVMDHFNKVFGSAEKLQKRADAVISKAENITGTAENKAFENANLFKKLHIDGKVDGLAAGSAGMNKAAEAALLQAVEKRSALVENYTTLMDEPEKHLANFKMDPQGNVGAMGLQKVGEAEGFSAPNGMAVYRGAQMPGGQAVIVVDADKAVTGIEAMDCLARAYEKVGAFNPKAKEVSGTKLTTLSVGDVQTIAKEVRGVGETLQQFRKPFAKLEKALKDAAAKAEKVGKQADKEDEADKKKLLAAVRKGCANLPKFLATGPASFATYSLNTGKAMLDYCELSLKEYKGDKK